jgi:hypothetical protein
MASRVEVDLKDTVEQGEVVEATTDEEAWVIRQIASATARRRGRVSCRIVGPRQLEQEEVKRRSTCLR